MDGIQIFNQTASDDLEMAISALSSNVLQNSVNFIGSESDGVFGLSPSLTLERGAALRADDKRGLRWNSHKHQERRPHANAEYARQSPIDPTANGYPSSSQKHSTKRGHASNKQSASSSASSVSRFDARRRRGIRLIRRACSRLHLDQIRPHGLTVRNEIQQV
jgi:hypothetical protein